ncbi:MAG TPA: hypothetical protein ENH06_00970 [bacterium]|nr:hypothetical protein [bacterium]
MSIKKREIIKKFKKQITKFFKKENKNISNSIILVLIGVIIGGTVFSYYIPDVSKECSYHNPESTEATAYLKFKEIKKDLIPSGIPDVYGDELGISFDSVQDAINKVAPLGPTYGKEKITLEGADLERYIEIGSLTACQYCCGAKTLVFKDGKAACGCAHSQMMRGLAAYLIKNHPDFSDEEILNELNTWKITFFPKQSLSVKLLELEKAGEPGIKQLLKEFPDFLPEMVGGC